MRKSVKIYEQQRKQVKVGKISKMPMWVILDSQNLFIFPNMNKDAYAAQVKIIFERPEKIKAWIVKEQTNDKFWIIKFV